MKNSVIPREHSDEESHSDGGDTVVFVSFYSKPFSLRRKQDAISPNVEMTSRVIPTERSDEESHSGGDDTVVFVSFYPKPFSLRSKQDVISPNVEMTGLDFPKFRIFVL